MLGRTAGPRTVVALVLTAVLCVPAVAAGQTTQAAFDLEPHAATLSGVGPPGPAPYAFHYGPTDQYGTSVAASRYIGTRYVFRLTGLDAGVTYHFQIVAADGTAGGDQSFTTPADLNLPQRIGPPVMSTQPETGKLTCDNGTWADPQPTFAIDWLRDGAKIGSGPEYPTGPGDLNQTIECRVTATVDDNGTLKSTEATSGHDLGDFRPEAKKPTIPAVIRAGQSVKCDPGTWARATGAFTFGWLRDGTLIDGATADTYAAAPEDLAHKLACQASTANAGGTSSATSDAVTVLPAPAAQGTPVQPGQSVLSPSASAPLGCAGGVCSSAVASGADAVAQSTAARADPAAVTKALRALLSTRLPSARAALRAGGVRLLFAVPARGRLTVQWRRSGSRALLARGTRLFDAAGSGVVAVKLTALGRRVLRAGGPVTVAATVGFRPVGGKLTQRAKRLVLS